MGTSKHVCSFCGSENVLVDAWAAWDVAKQTWQLSNVFDAGYCEDCDGEASLKEVESRGRDVGGDG